MGDHDEQADNDQPVQNNEIEGEIENESYRRLLMNMQHSMNQLFRIDGLDFENQELVQPPYSFATNLSNMLHFVADPTGGYWLSQNDIVYLQQVQRQNALYAQLLQLQVLPQVFVTPQQQQIPEQQVQDQEDGEIVEKDQETDQINNEEQSKN
ncbi:unnamed protein product [Caenorhabditis angaria]|uniref:Uncharacterized protein n=1 Tax=Caenorhabditis angaria TaxID=860376 RepID=A0A9P1IX86_9PELO|nr:unnamed protein product [Caenorhabditis angaria]